MDRRLSAAPAGQYLVCAACDHLIDVHIALGAAPCLPDDERELIVEFASDDVFHCRFDRLGLFGRRPVAPVDPRRSLLDERERVDDLDWHALARAEGEVLDRPLRLRAPIGAARDCDFSEAVAFDPCLAHPASILVTRTAPAQIIATMPSNCQ